MTRELSPSFPCPFCGGEDYSRDGDRWSCTNCALAGRPKPIPPEFSETFNFREWYRWVMGEWKRVNLELAEVEKSPEPDPPGQRLIRKAKIAKLGEEYNKIDRLAEIASYIDGIRRRNKGIIYIKVPDLRCEIKVELDEDDREQDS